MARAQHTLQELHDAAKARGGECLSSEYVGVDKKYRFRCAKGHEWETTFRKVALQGTWCARCSGLRPDKAERYEVAKQAARDRGGKLLSTEYRNVDALMSWRCAAGHEWETSFDCVVRRGQWCAMCSGKKVDTGAQMQRARATAASKGGSCLSDGYTSSQQQMRWRCAEGHEWEGTFSNIVNRGKWCPWCAGNKVAPEIQMQRACDTAHAHGGELLTSIYQGNKAPMRWRCAEGHEWEAAFSTVVGRGAWCGRCLGTHRDAEEQLAKARALAASKNGECLSSTYATNSAPMKWRCERGHIWEAAFYTVVQAGSWCPTCSAGLKERLVRHTLEQLFGKPFKKHRPLWLRNPRTGRLMELDGFNPVLNLAFEYQGPQHYKVVLPFKMDKAHLERGKYRDDLKKSLCLEHGVILLEVPYTVEAQELPEWIYRALESRTDTQHLVPQMRDWQTLHPTEWVESEHYSIDDLRTFARAKGGDCLSRTYLGARDKHRWRCQEGHEWEAAWDSVNNQGSWCPVCCGNVILNPLERLREAAKRRGGKLVTPTYLGTHSKHRWRCAEGHEWEAQASHVVRGESWCPYCAGHKIENPIQQLKALAESRGGECLSPEYVTSATKLRWCCAEGHEWEAIPSSVKRGRWCPVCAVKHRIVTRRKPK